LRSTPDPLAFLRAIGEAPFAHGFFQTLRCIEALYPGKPRLGSAPGVAEEPVRLGQQPALDFAPATLSGLVVNGDGRAPRLEVRFLGLLGPNGPLPLHLTEYARERLLHAGDATFARFLDLFNHRFLAMFYRAWAQAQPTVQLDRPTQDRFAIHLGALAGDGVRDAQAPGTVPAEARLFFAGILARGVRNRDGLEALLAGFFDVRASVEEFVGHWMEIPAPDRARLGSREANAALGCGAALGRSVWDRQHRIRVHLGPLDLARYEDFLPGRPGMLRLAAWLRKYVGRELAWDLRLVLDRDHVPRARLGRHGRVGWTVWLGRRRAASHAADLTLDPDAQRDPGPDRHVERGN
jgi:type VI secretion system protein ImpH